MLTVVQGDLLGLSTAVTPCQGLSETQDRKNTNSNLSSLQINHNTRQTHSRWSEGLPGTPFRITGANKINTAKNTREYSSIYGGQKSDAFSSGYVLPLKYLRDDLTALPAVESSRYWPSADFRSGHWSAKTWLIKSNYVYRSQVLMDLPLPYHQGLHSRSNEWIFVIYTHVVHPKFRHINHILHNIFKGETLTVTFLRSSFTTRIFWHAQ